MNHMFYKCLSLDDLNLNNFNTDNFKEMTSMFFGFSKELKRKIKSRYKNLTGIAFISFSIRDLL